MKQKEVLGSTFQEIKFPSGIKLIACPNPNYATCCGGISFNFGSLDTHIGDYVIPAGAAHFLEHRLFDRKDLDVMETFAALGASSNAFTSYEQTSYFFKGTKKAAECLHLLLRFVFDLQSTTRGVEKEKPIVFEEIKMVGDNLNEILFKRTVKNCYATHPVLNDICGTIESVQAITHADVRKIHKHFYHPSNATIYLTGNFDLAEMERIITARTSQFTKKKFPKRPNYHEPAQVIKTIDRVVSENVVIPRMALAVKLPPLHEKRKQKEYVCYQMYFDLLFNPLSPVIKNLQKENAIAGDLRFNYFFIEGAALLYFSADAFNPERVISVIKETLTNAKKLMKRSLFNVNKRSLIGDLYRSLNTANQTFDELIESSLQGLSTYELAEATAKLRWSDVVRMRENVDPENSSVVIVDVGRN